MKIQLNERTLNAYLMAAINEEVNEIFGSKRNKENDALIADLAEQIKKLEEGLVTAENAAGINSKFMGRHQEIQVEGGGFDFKDTTKENMTKAINILNNFADRISNLERDFNINAVMENRTCSYEKLMLESVTDWPAWEYALRTAISNNNTSQFLNLIKRGVLTHGFATQIINFLRATGGSWARIGFDLLTKLGAYTGAAAGSAAAGGAAAGAAGSAAAGSAAAGAAGSAAAGGSAAGSAAAGVGAAAGAPVAAIVAAVAIVVGVAAHCVLVTRANKKQRYIVRVYNCVKILAKRLANVLEYFRKNKIGNSTIQEGVRTFVGNAAQSLFSGVNGMDGGKASSLIGTIQKTMAELSNLMQSVYVTHPGKTPMPASLNTRNEVRQFQLWTKEHGITDMEGKLLVDDGIFGRRTNYVYDKVAKLLSTSPSTEPATLYETISEGNGFYDSLEDLERKVGTTGSGGAAWAGDESGNDTGSNQKSNRENSEIAYNIASTYPQVLNKYLEILTNLGFNTKNLEPLPIKTDKNWASGRVQHDIEELKAIQSRISRLLYIVENGKPNGISGIKLPPKPNVAKPKPPVLPVIDTNVDIEEPEVTVPDFEDLDTSTPEVSQVGYSNPKAKDQTLKERDYVDVIIDRMREICSDTSASLKVKRNWLDRAYNNGVNYINSLVASGDLTKKEAKLQIQKLTYYYKQFIKGDRNAMFGQKTKQQEPQQPQQEPQQPQRQEPVLVEHEFKKLVKQILREEFFK